MASDDTGRLGEQIHQWRDELIDLTRRNRLLNLSGRGATVEILKPGFDAVIAGLVDMREGWRFHYPPLRPDEESDTVLAEALAVEDPDLSDEVDTDELLTTVDSARKLSNQLKTMERRASSEWIDKGIRVLYLAVGILKWADAEGQQLDAPLLLIPVRLYRPTVRDPFRLTATDDDWTANPALAVKLESDFGITLPDYADEQPVADYLDLVTGAVGPQNGWTVNEGVVLSTFSFQKDAMYRDLRDNEARILNHDLIRAIGLGETVVGSLGFDPVTEDQLDVVAPPEDLVSILDADATQRACIVAARDGHSFVMDGPPGTGKSQTIANLIAELIHRGQTVLFVSEKAAALDVVNQRLRSAGLHHFVLELHSAKATRKEFANALGEALESRPRANGELSDVELVELGDARRKLNDYSKALNESRQPMNHSLHWAIGRRSQLESAPRGPVPDNAGQLTQSEYAEITLAATQLAQSWGPVERRATFLWRDLRDVNSARASVGALDAELEGLLNTHRSLVEATERLRSELGVASADDEASVDWVVQLLQLRSDPQYIEVNWVTDESLDPVRDLASKRRAECDDIQTRRRKLDTNWSGWEGLAPGLGDRLKDARQRLANLATPCPEISAESSLEQIHDVRRRLEQVGDLAAAVDNASQQIAAFSGLDPTHTVPFAEQMVKLAALAGRTNRPEPAWLTPDGLTHARDAAHALRPPIEQYKNLVTSLRQLFNEGIFTIDIESFYDNEHDVSAHLSMLTGRGRTNRRQLKACVLSGDITDDVVNAVAGARHLRRLASDIHDVETTWAGWLGGHYYRRDATDFAAMQDALDVAERVLQLARTADPARTAACFSRQALDSAAMLDAGRNLEALLAGLASTAGATVPTAALLAAADLPAIVNGARSVAATVAELGQRLEDVRSAVPSIDRLAPAETVATEYDSLLHAEADLASAMPADQRVLGTTYQAATTDWAALERSLDWITALRALYGGPMSEQSARALEAVDPSAWPLAEQHRVRSKAFDELAGRFTAEYAAEIRQELAGPADDAAALLEELRSTLGDIEEWASFVAARKRLTDRGAQAIVDFCAREPVPRSAVAGTIERAVMSGWIDRQLASDPRCFPLRSAERDGLVTQFQQLDARHARHAAAAVVNACAARRPNNGFGEAAIIRTESQRKTRHRPIRTLLNDAASVVRALKPCFMMSPLSVSQYLGPDFTFDVVIFDEASQVRPCDAINCIYRGRRLIVAGDERQLPPTSFFETASGDDSDEYDEDALEDFESVLALCRRSASLRPLPLRWHYRSRHESLITFSNRRFYGGELISYPGAHEISPELGVEFFHVPDGVYMRGGARDNPIEARRVVERVMFHAENHPHRTLGVVAFSEAQATRIERELEVARRDRPDLDQFFAEDRLDGFFVKNLESVQGDERDIIIFSIGYGRDEQGRFQLYLGPLTRKGGERRLNVAVTRARRRIEVVSSITGADINESSGSAGVQALRAYLRYAAEGQSALLPEPGTADGEPESAFEVEVRRVIESWGYLVRSQVGHAGYRIDLGVVHPNHDGDYALAVECDGAAYHSSSVARDRDRLRQDVLEGLGWQMYRVWGPAWYRDRANEELRLKDAIERTVRGESLKPRGDDTPRPAPTPDIEVATVDLDALPDWVVGYEPYAGNVRTGLEITDPRARADLESLVLAVVQTEGPIVADLVTRRVCDAWGVRKSQRVRTSINSVVAHMLASASPLREAEPKVYVVGPIPETVRSGGPHGVKRTAAEVPTMELRHAVRRIVEDAHSIPVEELKTRVARIFGWMRTGSSVATAIEQAITEAAREGFVTVDGSGVARPHESGT